MATGVGIMLLDQAALCKQAAMLESMELRESRFHPSFMSELETLLRDVYASLLPNAYDYEQRKQLVQLFNKTAKNTFGDTDGFPAVVAFGSFIMDLFTATSDLDLSINFNGSSASSLSRDQVISIVRRFTKVLRQERCKGLLSSVMPVPYARVPVLKAVDCKTGIECDISVENKDGISRSLFLSIICSIDERFWIMCYLMKAWAKANKINSSRYQTLNSLSLILLVALHFQTRDPPILPPFSMLLREGIDFANMSNAVLELSKSARRNTESVAELFIALLAKLISVEKLWELGLCASNFEGSWISKDWTSKTNRIMNVEDFLDRSQNCARSVGKKEMPKIYRCLRGALGYLCSSMKGQIKMSALRTLLFKSNPHADANTNAGASLELKQTLIQRLPIESIQPGVDTITQVQTTVSHKRKKKSAKSAKPGVATPKLPIQTHANSKKPHYTQALPPSSYENQNYMLYPNYMIHPALSFAPPPPPLLPPPPLPPYGFVQSNISGYQHPTGFDTGYQRPAASNAGYHQPVDFNMGRRHPSANHLAWDSQHGLGLQYIPMVPETSRMIQHFPRPSHSMSWDSRQPSEFPGHSMLHNNYTFNQAGYPQFFVPGRSFGPNYPSH